jgi:hypothetical protein
MRKKIKVTQNLVIILNIILNKESLFLIDVFTLKYKNGIAARSEIIDIIVHNIEPSFASRKKPSNNPTTIGTTKNKQVHNKSVKFL